MANPVGSILHSRFILQDNSDRSSKYSFAFNVECRDSVGALVTPAGADLTSLEEQLVFWLNSLATGQTNALAYYIGISASRATLASEIAFFDISNALGLHEPAGSPYTVYPFTLGNAASTPAFPEQVAHVVALRTAYGTDPEYGTHLRPRANDRNRLFFGPLNADCFTSDAETPVRCKMNPNFTGDMVAATTYLFSQLLAPIGTGNSWLPVVWSREKASVAPISFMAQDVYPRTQRRRTSKTSNLVWAPII